MTFDDEIVKSFAEGFYGYGHFGASVWFVGMEEGGGLNPEEIQSRLESWVRRGRRPLEEIREFHKAFGENRWFAEAPQRQPTWAGLIRIGLGIEGLSVSNGKALQNLVLANQRDKFVQPAGEQCLMELLPLPSPSIEAWRFYAKHSHLRQLADRKLYTKYYAPPRADIIRQRIQKHKPGVVVFYGTTYRRRWNRIVGAKFPAVELDGISFQKVESTLFVLVPHPANPYRHRPDEYFLKVGAKITAML
jgi:hypothetical protein